jgi:hypothetical protein
MKKNIALGLLVFSSLGLMGGDCNFRLDVDDDGFRLDTDDDDSFWDDLFDKGIREEAANRQALDFRL